MTTTGRLSCLVVLLGLGVLGCGGAASKPDAGGQGGTRSGGRVGSGGNAAGTGGSGSGGVNSGGRGTGGGDAGAMGSGGSAGAAGSSGSGGGAGRGAMGGAATGTGGHAGRGGAAGSASGGAQAGSGGNAGRGGAAGSASGGAPAGSGGNAGRGGAAGSAGGGAAGSTIARCSTTADCTGTPFASGTYCSNPSWSCVEGQCNWECMGGRTCVQAPSSGCLRCGDPASMSQGCVGTACVIVATKPWMVEQLNCQGTPPPNFSTWYCTGQWAIQSAGSPLCTIQTIPTGAERWSISCGSCVTIVTNL